MGNFHWVDVLEEVIEEKAVKKMKEMVSEAHMRMKQKGGILEIKTGA